jgi:hypothetical protein
VAEVLPEHVRRPRQRAVGRHEHLHEVIAGEVIRSPAGAADGPGQLGRRLLHRGRVLLGGQPGQVASTTSPRCLTAVSGRPWAAGRTRQPPTDDDGLTLRCKPC